MHKYTHKDSTDEEWWRDVVKRMNISQDMSLGCDKK
jgi:hypothetical protein